MPVYCGWKKSESFLFVFPPGLHLPCIFLKSHFLCFSFLLLVCYLERLMTALRKAKLTCFIPDLYTNLHGGEMQQAALYLLHLQAKAGPQLLMLWPLWLLWCKRRRYTPYSHICCSLSKCQQMSCGLTEKILLVLQRILKNSALYFVTSSKCVQCFPSRTYQADS